MHKIPQKVSNMDEKWNAMLLNEDEVKKLTEFSKRSAEIEDEMMDITCDMRTKLREFLQLEAKRSLRFSELAHEFADSFREHVVNSHMPYEHYGIFETIRCAFVDIFPRDNPTEYRRLINLLYDRLDVDEVGLSQKWVSKEFCYTLEDVKFINSIEMYCDEYRKACRKNISICPSGAQKASTIKSNKKTDGDFDLIARRVNVKDPLPMGNSMDAWTECHSESGKKYYYNTEVSQWEKPEKLAVKGTKKSLASTSKGKVKAPTSTYSNPSVSEILNFADLLNGSIPNLWNGSHSSYEKKQEEQHERSKERLANSKRSGKMNPEATTSSSKRFISSGLKVKKNADNPETKVNIRKKINFNEHENLHDYLIQIKLFLFVYALSLLFLTTKIFG